MAKVKAVPEGYHTITPHLVLPDCAQAIDFYKKAFGAEEIVRMPGPGGSVMHAELKIGDSIFMLGEEMPDMGSRSPKAYGGSPVGLYVYVENVDALWAQAVKAGATPVRPLTNMFWGDRTGRLQDPFGHNWSLAQHIEDPTPEQMAERQEAFFAQMETTS
ncbi:MAG TPA: VOC family protein [Gemmatimonadales bacterium]|nr:VOC family protein [Gemmatimonadales bacterium]